MIDTAKAKAWLKVEHADEDALIAGLVNSAVAHIEAITGKFLSPKAFTQTLRGFPVQSPYLVKLHRGPVTGITSVAYDPSDGSVEATVLNFRLAEGHGRFFNGTLQPAFGERWPGALAGAGTVRITGTAGYAEGEAPELDTACLQLVAHWYLNREAVATGTIATELPMTVKALIGPYRPPGLG